MPSKPLRSALKDKRVHWSEEPTKHATLWFADGDIVLKAEQTLFRVHSATLRTASSAFNELTTALAKGIYEGAPVFELRDSQEDLAFFIAAVYGKLK